MVVASRVAGSRARLRRAAARTALLRCPGDEQLAVEAELLTANRAIRFVLALLACDALSGASPR